MAEAQDEQIQEALERAEEQKRPADLDNSNDYVEETSQNDDGWKRPERVEHTSEKEHPPGKE